MLLLQKHTCLSSTMRNMLILAFEVGGSTLEWSLAFFSWARNPPPMAARSRPEPPGAARRVFGDPDYRCLVMVFPLPLPLQQRSDGNYSGWPAGDEPPNAAESIQCTP